MKKTDTIQVVGGSSLEVKHSFSEREKNAYVDYFNSKLGNNLELVSANLVPVNSQNFFDEIAKGILLCKFINETFHGLIPNDKIHMTPKNAFEQNENHELAITAAKALGCSIVNIGGKDLTDKVLHLVMGLTWQLIKASLLKTVKDSTALLHEKIEGLDVDLPPELILLHWFNYHLDRAHHPRKVKDFGESLTNCEAYAVLLTQIAPDHCNMEKVAEILKEADLEKRAGVLLEIADKIGCRKFVTPKDIVEGNPRLNLAFVATLFDKFPALGPTKEQLALEKAGSLEKQLQEVKAAVSNLEATNQTLQEEKAKLLSSQQQLSSTLTEQQTNWEQAKTKLEEDLKDVQQKLGNLEGLKKQLEEQLNQTKQSSEQELNQLKETSQAEIKKLKDQAIEIMKQASTEIQELKTENTELTDEIARLKQELKQRDLKIKKLEDIVALLKDEMKESMSAKEMEKIQALEKAEQEKQKALVEAKNQKEAELQKLAGLLSGSQKAGWLWKEKHGFKAKPWHKRYFVLKDNLLAWYRDEVAAKNTRASGVLRVEDYVLFVPEDKDQKRAFGFELVDKQNNIIRLAATSPEEFKVWVESMKLAKEKRLAQENAAKK